jgi:hypothetical protein
MTSDRLSRPENALLWAAETRDHVEAALRYGADAFLLGPGGGTALDAVIRRDCLPALEALFELTPLKPTGLVGQKCFPIAAAGASGATRCFEYLLGRLESPQLPPGHPTLLQLAVLCREPCLSVHLAMLVLKAFPDIDMDETGIQGQTALSAAVSMNRHLLVEWLLVHGASPDTDVHETLSLLDMTLFQAKTAMTTILLPHFDDPADAICGRKRGREPSVRLLLNPDSGVPTAGMVALMLSYVDFDENFEGIYATIEVVPTEEQENSLAAIQWLVDQKNRTRWTKETYSAMLGDIDTVHRRLLEGKPVPPLPDAESIKRLESIAKVRSNRCIDELSAAGHPICVRLIREAHKGWCPRRRHLWPRGVVDLVRLILLCVNRRDRRGAVTRTASNLPPRLPIEMWFAVFAHLPRQGWNPGPIGTRYSRRADRHRESQRITSF